MVDIRLNTFCKTIPLFVLLVLMGSCKGNKKLNVSKDASEVEVKNIDRASIGAKLKENNHFPIEERIALYHRLKNSSPDAYIFENEDDLTMYGYSLFWDEKTAEAIEIFKLIVSEFPQSANAYDSLGEAYLESGDKEKALANYEKSVAMNPENYFGLDQISRIKGTYQAPEKLSEKFAKVFTAQAYREDLDALGKKLIEINPSALKFISEEDFLSLIESKKALISDHTTYAEFTWHCHEIIASINCSHTSAGDFWMQKQMLPPELSFPLEVRWVNEKLYVVDPRNNGDKVAIKDEIVSINGVDTEEILDDIYKHIQSQGFIETYKRYQFNWWASVVIPYQLGFPASYEITVRGKDNLIALNPVDGESYQFEEPFKQPCPERLCLDILDDETTAILTISSFNYYWWSNLDEFKTFVDNGFQKILEQSIENLVIDVRFNGGGSQHASIHLLKYIVNEPFTYYSTSLFDQDTGPKYPFENSFKGKLYFMIDGQGNSTTGHFMSIVKDLGLGVIVGEELGSNQFCTAGQTICRLPSTNLEYYVANTACESSATSLPDEKGILPDHFVSQSIDDYLNNIDVVKEYTLELIQ